MPSGFPERATTDGAAHDADAELVKRALLGDRVAFSQLVSSHYDLIYRLAYRWMGNGADAEDVAQDVCVKLARALAHFEGRSRFTTWLSSMVINASRDALRQKGRRKTRELDETVHQIAADDRSDEVDAAEELWAAVRQLPPRQADSVLLVYAEDKSHAEAAAILGCSESTVSWHIHEARKALRSLLTP